MANQPILRNWSRELPNLTKLCKIMVITPFKVILCHRLWYQSRAHMPLPI